MQPLYNSLCTVLGSSLINLYKKIDLRETIRPGYETYFTEQLQQELQLYLFWLELTIEIPPHCIKNNRVALRCFKSGTKLLNHFAIEVKFDNRFHGNEIKKSKEFWSKEGYEFFIGVAIGLENDFGLYIFPLKGLDHTFINKKNIEEFLPLDVNGKNPNDFNDDDFFKKDREKLIILAEEIVKADRQDKKTELLSCLKEYYPTIAYFYDYY